VDKRNSKETLLREIKRLGPANSKINAVYNAGIDGIYYVGRANYIERENEAIRKLNEAMYGEGEI
jgi:hypothetical protein